MWQKAGSLAPRARVLPAVYMAGYKRFNSTASHDAPANIRNDLDLLIHRKLKLFPDDQRQIPNEGLVMVG